MEAVIRDLHHATKTHKFSMHCLIGILEGETTPSLLQIEVFGTDCKTFRFESLWHTILFLMWCFHRIMTWCHKEAHIRQQQRSDGELKAKNFFDKESTATCSTLKLSSSFVIEFYFHTLTQFWTDMHLTVVDFASITSKQCEEGDKLVWR